MHLSRKFFVLFFFSSDLRYGDGGDGGLYTIEYFESYAEGSYLLKKSSTQSTFKNSMGRHSNSQMLLFIADDLNMARWLACLSDVSCVGPDEVQIDQKHNSKVDNYIQLIVQKSLLSFRLSYFPAPK